MTFSSRAVRVLGTGYTSGGASERLARGPVLAPLGLWVRTSERE
jgi:hypothetical protein